MTLLLRLAVLACLMPSAHAATFTVTRQDDPSPNGCLPGDCSLREAVLAANATAAADTIVLGNGSYLLNRTCQPDTASCQDLDVTQPLTIRGMGPAMTSIRMGITQAAAAGKDRAHTRVIESTGVKLRLAQLALRYGYVAVATGPIGGQDKRGGCIYVNGGSLEASSVTVEGCQIIEGGGLGGGIHLQGASATFSNVTIAGNSAGTGGGLYAQALSATVGASIGGTNVDIINNVAEFTGGGAYLVSVSNLILGGASEISGNTAIIGNGGGIAVSSLQGATIGGSGAGTADRLQVMGNSAGGAGGGVAIHMVPPIGSIGDYHVHNMKVQGNSSDGPGAGVSIYLIAPSGPIDAVVSDIEFAENDTAMDGGGLNYVVSYNSPPTATTSELRRLSFWGNSAGKFGGAMSVQAAVPIRNVSSTGNAAVLGGSALIVKAASTSVEFFTSYGDIGESVRVNQAASFRASVFDGNCTGVLTDGGANVVRTGVTGCPGSPASTPSLALGFGNFGGGHPVVGITNASSVLRNRATFAPAMTDVRGYLRVGVGDAGAFEFDGTPQ